MNCPIQGVVFKKLTQYDDDRGWLIELFREDEVPEANVPVMSYFSMTRPGVARGPHEHADQDDMFCFVGPSTFRLYLWDNRKDSPTHGSKWCGDFGETNKVSVIVPVGVVHAYKNIGTVEGIVFNAPNRLYAGRGRKEPVDEIRHEDLPGSPFLIDALDADG